MENKFLAPRRIWQPYHRWFLPDHSCIKMSPGPLNTIIFRVDTEWIISIIRKDLKPVIHNGAVNFALVMGVYPEDAKSISYRFYLN